MLVVCLALRLSRCTSAPSSLRVAHRPWALTPPEAVISLWEGLHTPTL